MSETTTTETTASGKQVRLGWALVLISIAQLMVVLDATIANIALPYIQDSLDISNANLPWIVTGYALAFGGFLLLGGRLGRPLRPAPHLHGRPGDLRGRLAARRPRAERGAAARGPGPAGLRCGARLPRRPGADHHDLPGRTGPQPRVRGLRRDVRRRCGRRPDPRWLADRPAPRHRRPVHRGLAADLPDQRPDRHRRRAARTAGAGRVRAPPRRARRPGRHHRHRRPARHRLRPEPGRTSTAGATPGPSSAWSSARCCSRCSC